MESRIIKDGGMYTETNRITRDGQTDILQIRHNVSRNPICTVTNVPLASVTGKESHSPIFSMLAMHGGQVKRDR